MQNRHGDFIWYELMTTDREAAELFYGRVVGWRFSSDAHYRHIEASEGMIGGVLPLSPDMTAGGARPAWVGYLTVDDVDASVERITAAGGKVLMPARDMEDVGRIAMVADPQGAPFYVMRPQPPSDRPDETSHAFAADRPMFGHCAWNELASEDPEAAKAFYREQFGWIQDGDLDMGPLGKYQFLWDGERRFMLGAIMPKMPQQPVSTWSFYFRVPDIDEAADTIKEQGGTLFQEPMEIPGGEFSINASDPQGVAFGLVGPRKEKKNAA
jgi:uncharacterized protein